MTPAVVSTAHANGARPSPTATKANVVPNGRFFGNGSGGQGIFQSEKQHTLKPLPRSRLGSVYSKKMTLGGGLKPSSSSRKLSARTNRGGAAAAKHGGLPAARLMLPWWQHSASKISVEHEEVHAASQEKRVGNTQSPTQQSTPASTPNHRVRESNQGDSSDGDSCALKPRAICGDNVAEKTEANGYTHYSNLFENPPPTIPTVDQYIFDQNILYESITKRGHRKALPMNPSGGGTLGIQECGDDPWAAAVLGSTREDGLEAYVDPQDLLYADEDIDQVRRKNDIFDILPRIEDCRLAISCHTRA